MGLLVRILIFLVCLAMPLVSIGFAQQFEYKEYVVKPGDTLWDITKRELKDAFQWPLVWKENLRINNPDLIYPGQVIQVPVRVISQEVSKLEPTVEVSKAVPGVPPVEIPVAERPKYKPRKLKVRKPEAIVTREALLASGYITRNVPYHGEITHSAVTRTMFGAGDEIYIDTLERAEAGSKFYIIRKENRVQHPVTGRSLGYLVRVLGTVEVQETGQRGLKARVTESFDSITVGDYLDIYYEVYPPFVIGEPRRPEVDAVVVASEYMRTINGGFDIVFIDKGSNDGLKEGDVLMSLYRGTDDRQNSIIQLVNLRRTTSLGLVIKSEDAVRHGDMVVGMK